MNKCYFKEPHGDFVPTESLKFRVFVKVVDLLRMGVYDFVFIKGKFNKICYEIVSEIKRLEYFGINRIYFATEEELVCEKNEKAALERLFKIKAGLDIEFLIAERVFHMNDICDYNSFTEDCKYVITYKDVY